jgi:2-polyprenyl-6-hydroxyphenyl methylase/3-demethylubiquinone-9 3-methyltransferase
MNRYYVEKLAAERLRRCYDLAPPRVKQYLKAEASLVAGKIAARKKVLELGCGYGRFLKLLLNEKAGLSPNFQVYGIDISHVSLKMAQESLGDDNCRFICMDAIKMAFRDDTFDTVLCIQNGISALHTDNRNLFIESMRIVQPGGILLFSSYSAKFWKHRLEWFEIQSKAGLLGPIDYDKSVNGRIICKDGFRSNTVGPEEFMDLTRDLDADVYIEEVDESSIFCEIVKK